MTRRRVVVTGMGVVSPVGNDVPAFWQSLLAGRSGVAFIRDFPIDKLRSDVKKAEKDLDRLREHLKALGSAAAGGTDGNPLLKRILETEDRLSATQKRVEILDADQEKRKDAVRKVLERLPKPREAQNP